MTGKLNGVPVTWSDNRESSPINVGVDRAAFAEFQRSQYAGPSAESIKCKFVLASGVDHVAVTAGLVDQLRVFPFAVAEEPFGFFLDETQVFLRVQRAAPQRAVGGTVTDLQAIHAGSPATHDVGVITTSIQRENIYSQAGVTAVRVPGSLAPVGETVDDATRRVIQTPSAFATLDGAYDAGASVRNANAPILVPASSTPEDLYAGIVKATIAAQDRWGSRRLASDGTTENVAVRLSYDAGAETVTLTDLIAGAATSTLVLTLAAWTRASYAGAGLSLTANRATILLDNADQDRIEVRDDGNVLLFPGGSTFNVGNGATTRALASGVYYHEVFPDAYLVSTSDFTVAANGDVADYDAGATFGFVFSTTIDAPRFREVLMDTLTSWVLVRRS